MTIPVISASARREQIQQTAAQLGIDDAYISILVDRFYDRVRADPTIGPVFENAIGDVWDHHLDRMKDFWASVAMNAGRYSGKPVPKHKQHTTIEDRHFAIWLTLFHQTLEETAPSPDVIPYFMVRAERIAQSLQLALFGVPGVRPTANKRKEVSNA